jgi:hypothetical protein
MKNNQKRTLWLIAIITIIAIAFTACSDPINPIDNGEQEQETADVFRLVWQGELDGAPANPVPGWVYFNKTDGKTYVFFDGAWHQFAIEGEQGPKGDTPVITVDANGNLLVDGTPVGNIKGPQGDAPAITVDANGNLLVDGTPIGNIKGPKGDSGLTPYIGDCGFWHIGGTKDDCDGDWCTGIPATGQTGGQGDKGDQGDPGLTPYVGDCGNWHIGGTADVCDTACTGLKAVPDQLVVIALPDKTEYNSCIDNALNIDGLEVGFLFNGVHIPVMNYFLLWNGELIANDYSIVAMDGEETIYVVDIVGRIAEFTILVVNGHTPGADATCTTAQTCTACGFEIEAAFGHDLSGEQETVSLGVLAKICQRSGCDGIGDAVFEYSIGEEGPAGGVIFYIADGQDGRLLGFTVQASPDETPEDREWTAYTAYYLEVALTNAHTTTVAWADAHGQFLIPGLTTFTETSATESFIIGNGRKDTQIIVNHLATTELTGRAAQRAVEERDGFNDWFLPSAGELRPLYTNRADVNLADGNLGTNAYWSSSQHTTNYAAWDMIFSNGSLGTFPTLQSSNRVRAIRAF